VDAMGGTSIGGILTLMLASGYSFQKAHEKFKDMAEKAFSRSFWSIFDPWGPKFDGVGLENALETIFEDKTLGQLRMPVLIPTLDFQHNVPKIYDNIIKDSDFLIPLKVLSRKTSAAPTYFPPAGESIDGGLLANNPVLETAVALKAKLGIPFNKMDVLVLGTGHYPVVHRDMEEVAGWSSAEWLKPMLNYLTKANELKSNFIAKWVGFKSYRLYDPVTIDTEWDMAEPDLIPELEIRTSPFLSEFRTVFREFVKS